MGDEDSTAAAGHGLGTSGRTGRRDWRGQTAAFFGGGDSGGGGRAAQQLDDEDDSVDANKAKEPRAYPRGIVAPIDRVRSHKLPAMNSVHVPLQNPVFAAFTACGTRLLLMNVRRHGEEFALHELDLTVAMASLHGATPGAAGARGSKFLAKNQLERSRRVPSVVEEIPSAGDDDDDDDDDDAANVRGVGPDGWLSADARETLTLVESGRELSFSPGPSTRDVLSLANGAVVGKISPANLRAWSGLDECTTRPVAGGARDCVRPARALEQDEDVRMNERLRREENETASEGSFELDGDELEEERDNRAATRNTHPAWRAGAGGAGGASPVPSRMPRRRRRRRRPTTTRAACARYRPRPSLCGGDAASTRFAVDTPPGWRR